MAVNLHDAASVITQTTTQPQPGLWVGVIQVGTYAANQGDYIHINNVSGLEGLNDVLFAEMRLGSATAEISGLDAVACQCTGTKISVGTTIDIDTGTGEHAIFAIARTI